MNQKNGNKKDELLSEKMVSRFSMEQRKVDFEIELPSYFMLTCFCSYMNQKKVDSRTCFRVKIARGGTFPAM